MAIVYFTAGNKIMKDSLSTLAVDNFNKSKKPSVVVGGIATQLHCSSMKDKWRSTCDIDVVNDNLFETYMDFYNDVGGNIFSLLKNKGYHIQSKKIQKKPVFEIKIMDKPLDKANEIMFIHFNQYSNKSSPSYSFKQRTVDNASEKSYEGNVIKIARVEDIIATKNARTKKILKNNTLLSSLEASLSELSEQGKWADLAKIPLDSWLVRLTDEQNRMMNKCTKNPFCEYLFGKHMYDICLLSQLIEGSPELFNRAYHLESKRIVDSF
jgi:hypothetical protein